MHIRWSIQKLEFWIFSLYTNWNWVILFLKWNSCSRQKLLRDKNRKKAEQSVAVRRRSEDIRKVRGKSASRIFLLLLIFLLLGSLQEFGCTNRDEHWGRQWEDRKQTGCYTNYSEYTVVGECSVCFRFKTKHIFHFMHTLNIPL